MPQLEELYISDNLLTSVEPLSNTPDLRILDVQNNPITSLRGVSSLKHIENLWATSCKLDRFDELEKELGDKKELSEVYFEGNPLQKSNPVLYRNKVRLALPQVSKIDASKFTASISSGRVTDRSHSSLCESLSQLRQQLLCNRAIIAIKSPRCSTSSNRNHDLLNASNGTASLLTTYVVWTSTLRFRFDTDIKSLNTVRASPKVVLLEKPFRHSICVLDTSTLHFLQRARTDKGC